MVKPLITPQTRIGEFLDNYPELEELLINLSPAFEKLRNPVLRRTIGRVATFQQVAVVGNIPLETIINSLRKAAGQNQTNEIMSTNNYLEEKPSWFNTSAISETLDARQMLQAGQHPLADVMSKTSKMQSGQIFELITPFTPMPLIEKVNANGLLTYVQPVSESEVHIYFYKA
ncbi:MAG: DUF1858 domain-containing protein [Lentimicrobiaceae bacterium]|jgi:hypothetical protein